MTTAETYTLPENVRPSRYQIRLQPDLKEFTFKGSESIDIEIKEPTASIKLNAVDLQIQSAILVRDGAATIAHRVTFDNEMEMVTLEFPELQPPGPARLDVQFTGELNDKLHGFYRSQYQNPEGETAYLATTQFEATDARRAFPCWDEPACKARFAVTLVIPENLTAVSNMECLGEDPAAPGLKAVRFAESPVMSTYLVAFVVGDLAHIEKVASSGALVRVWTTRGKENQGTFALETSVKLLSFFNDYFGIPYPLKKLDHLAIPDFAAGAMENWGCITYRDTALLVDPQNSSAGTRQRVAEVVAHEMAHMWFGDLVTMAWWDDLWLNEGFASWMGDKSVDWAFPEWEMWTQFLNADANRALSLDGLKNSHPIEQPVKNPAEVSQLFDAISYSKGASIIRMLEQFLGQETFRQGLHRYLSAHKYANARTEDLWNGLAEASGLPVPAIMDTWTKQMGYPVLTVQSRRADGRLELTLRQERFVYDRLLTGGGSEPESWRVPVRVSAAGLPTPVQVVMDDKEAQVTLPAPANGGWFKVNSEQTGFFRVNYAPEDWARLAPAIASKELPAGDRLGLQNDAYGLSRAGLLPISQFMSLGQAFTDENDASVWSDLATNLREVFHLTAREPFHAKLEAFCRQLFQPAAQRVGWEPRPGEGHLHSLLRSTVLSQAGGYGDPATLAEARRRFDRYLENPATLHPDLRGLVYGLVGQEGDEATYNLLWDLYKKAPLQEEKMRLLAALARFKQPELLLETLNRSLSPDVRSQDAISVVTMVAGNLRGRDIAWQFLKDQWAEFDRRYGTGGFGLMRLVGISGAFASLEKLSEVEQFFNEHPVPAADRTIKQSLEKIRLNAAWLERNRSDLAAWLK